MEQSVTHSGQFAALKNRDYAFLWTGMLSASFAMNMQLVAQGWLVYAMTDSALNLALVTLSFMLPQVIFSLLGGVLADRIPKKPIILWCQAANGVATLIMALIIFTGHVTFGDFLWVGFINGTLLALSIPARTAFIPELVGERLLFNALSFNTAAWNLSRILGPPLAGYMIALLAGGDTTSTYGVGVVYVVISGLYLLAAVTVPFIRHAGQPTNRAPSSPLADIAEGLRYVVGSPIVGGLILLSIMPFLFGMSINTLMPAYNTDVLAGGAETLGKLMTGMGVGAVIGSLATARMGELRHKGHWLFATCLTWGLSLILFAQTSSLVLALAATSLTGFVSSINLAMNRSLTQLQVTQAMRGRVMSIDLMSHGLMPLGLIPISFVAEHYGVQAGIATSGSVLVLVTILLMCVLKSVRAIDRGYAAPHAPDPRDP